MENKTFGSYIVLERDYNSHPGAAAKYWKIKCIYCGEEKIMRADALKKCPICKCQKDTMIGKVFGDLLVLEKLKEKAKDKCNLYKCQCLKCGNIEIAPTNLLRSERKHCSKCYTAKTTLIDLTGQIFGFLKVIERDKS